MPRAVLVASVALALCVALACGTFGAADEAPADGGSESDATSTDATDANSDTRVISPGCTAGSHTFCEDFELKLLSGELDLSRWNNTNNGGFFARTTEAISPSFGIGVRRPSTSGPAWLEAKLEVPTTRIACTSYVRLAALPDGPETTA